MRWNKHNFEIYSDIKLICSQLHLPRYVEKELLNLYFDAVKKIRYTGRRERLIASLIYYISKRDGLHVTIKDISEVVGIEKYSLLRSYKHIMRKMGLEIKPRLTFLRRVKRFFSYFRRT